MRRGLTFVELLIAATMMSVLFVGLSAHLRGGLTVWSRATTTVERLQRHRVAWEHLERDLVNAVIYEDRDSAYGTEEGKLPLPEFGAEALRWFTVTAPSAQRPASVRVVTYACGDVEGRQGLWRTSQSVGEARAHRIPAPELVLPECRAFTVVYAYLPPAGAGGPVGALDWVGQWEDSLTTLPRLMKISMALPSGEALTRTVMIPSGVLKAPGAPAP